MSDSGSDARTAIYQAIYHVLRSGDGLQTDAGDLSGITDLADLRRDLLSLPSFKSALGSEARGHKSLIMSRSPLQVRVPQATLDKLLAATEETFETLARSEPHWTVLTAETFKAGNIADSKGAFYGTGEQKLIEMRSFAARAGFDLSKFHTCFELGSGVGRVTLWLARTFPKVIAADISRNMLAIAEEHLTAQGLGNVTYQQMARFDAFDRLEPFDFFFSSIVLQHNTPPVQRFMLETILDRLNVGGAALFQILTSWEGYEFDAAAYLENRRQGPHIEMHAFPQKELFELIEQCGCRLLEIREDGSCGELDSLVSNVVFVEKATARSKPRELDVGQGGMIEKDAVRWGYRLILGREPESEGVVDHFAGTLPSVAALRAEMFNSPEFRARNGFGLRIPDYFEANCAGSPRVFVISNCQGPEIARHLSCLTGLPVSGREVTSYRKDDVESWYAHCDRADIVIAAHLSEIFDGIRVHQLRERFPGKIHTIMPVFFEGLFPDTTVLGQMGERLEGPMYLHSRLMLRSFLKGETAEQCLASFNPEAFEAFGYFESWDLSSEEFRRRDGQADIQIAEPFFNRLYDAPLFFTNNHPTALLYRLICEQICKYFGFSPRNIPVDVMPASHALTPSWPVLDGVAERFGLKYRTSQLYTREYVTYDLPSLIDASYRCYAGMDRRALLAAVKQRNAPVFADLPDE